LSRKDNSAGNFSLFGQLPLISFSEVIVKIFRDFQLYADELYK